MFGLIKNKKRVLINFSFFVLFFLFLFPLFGASKVEAQHGLSKTAGSAGLTQYAQGGLQSLAGQVIGNLLSMVGVLFFILIVYGGVLWMTARGDEDQVSRGRNTIIAATIGIVVILASYALTSFVLGALQSGGTESSPNACETSADCGDNQQCQDGICVGTLGQGDSCNLSTECQPGYGCISGSCEQISGS